MLVILHVAFLCAPLFVAIVLLSFKLISKKRNEKNYFKTNKNIKKLKEESEKTENFKCQEKLDQFK
jgi:hypothetical protein